MRSKYRYSFFAIQQIASSMVAQSEFYPLRDLPSVFVQSPQTYIDSSPSVWQERSPHHAPFLPLASPLVGTRRSCCHRDQGSWL
jgi:hypothetical protein